MAATDKSPKTVERTKLFSRLLWAASRKPTLGWKWEFFRTVSAGQQYGSFFNFFRAIAWNNYNFFTQLPYFLIHLEIYGYLFANKTKFAAGWRKMVIVIGWELMKLWQSRNDLVVFKVNTMNIGYYFSHLTHKLYRLALALFNSFYVCVLLFQHEILNFKGFFRGKHFTSSGYDELMNNDFGILLFSSFFSKQLLFKLQRLFFKSPKSKVLARNFIYHSSSRIYF